MGEHQKEKFAGSYLELFVASAAMFLLFAIMLTWLIFKTPYGLMDNHERLKTVNFIFIVQFSLGPMIAVLAGIAFDTFPLVYNIQTFERTTMRHFLQLNVLGQLFILVGVFSTDWDLLIELSGIGIVLLSLSLLSLASPAIEVFRTKNEVDEVGVFSYTPGILLIICGVVVIASWFLRGIDGMIELGVSFTVALFSCMQIATCLLSHFNRRLGWEVTEPKSLQLKFALFFLIALAHIVISALRGRELVEETLVDISLSMLFILMFFIINPKKILQRSFGSLAKPHSRMVLGGYLLLPVLAIISAGPIWTGHQGIGSIQPAHWLLLASSGFLIVWGFALFLHEDHLHISLANRSTPWITFLSLMAGAVLICWSLYDKNVLTTGKNYAPFIGWAVAQMVGIFSLTYLLARHIFFPDQNWHRVPMFYNRYSSK
ncbi:MAG: hypothetical protein L7U53_02680 [Candidatus Poseidoniaceae archaeon]|nr:hypothetical protein [Candidatus Poseidoniaceae archaeon]